MTNTYSVNGVYAPFTLYDAYRNSNKYEFSIRINYLFALESDLEYANT